MARALGLDVYDDRRGIRFSATEPVVPREREHIRDTLDPAAAQPVRYTKATLRKAFIERLTPALAPHGFVGSKVDFASFFYKREVEGGGR